METEQIMALAAHPPRRQADSGSVARASEKIPARGRQEEGKQGGKQAPLEGSVEQGGVEEGCGGRSGRRRIGRRRIGRRTGRKRTVSFIFLFFC